LIELRERRTRGNSNRTPHLSYAPRGPPPENHAANDNTLPVMKPLVGAVQAWSCVVLSVFAIVILGVLALLFRANHHELVGGTDDPENGPEVAGTLFVAVLVYAGFLVFCGIQGMLHLRESRRGAIAL